MIGTNKKDAADTTSKVIAVRDAGALNEPSRPDAEESAAFLAERAPEAVLWDGWRAIDEHERGLGEPQGRPRAKLVRLEELARAAEGSPAATGGG